MGTNSTVQVCIFTCWMEDTFKKYITLTMSCSSQSDLISWQAWWTSMIQWARRDSVIIWLSSLWRRSTGTNHNVWNASTTNFYNDKYQHQLWSSHTFRCWVMTGQINSDPRYQRQQIQMCIKNSWKYGMLWPTLTKLYMCKQLRHKQLYSLSKTRNS